MKLKLYIRLFCAIYLSGFIPLYAQQILTPLGSNFKDEIILGESAEGNSFIGNGVFPVTYKESGYNLPEKDTTRRWLVRKLFHEHFLQVEGDDYFLAVDPLLHLSAGRDILRPSSERLFQNTRGIQAFGEIMGKVSFYTVFYENQARFADFRSDYFTVRGEQRLQNGEYQTYNAVIPGGGRTKPFKTSGFDYASSAANIRYKPFNNLSLQFGNTPYFIGWGHRSFLLSDNSFNFSNLKIDWEIIPGLEYSVIRGKQLNLLRRPYTNHVEAPYERKNFGAHYLNYKPSSRLSIGIFEAGVYLRDQGLEDNSVNPLFYQPIIGLNTVANGWESEDLKNLFGINFGWNFYKSNLLYAQLVTDNLSGSEYGAQLGWRSQNLFGVKNLRLQGEINIATDELYSARNRRMAYTHFNLPLAHTLGNGFKEVVIRFGYEWKRIYFDANSISYSASQSMRNKTTLFQDKTDPVISNQTKVSFNSLELGYVLNPATRLSLFAKGTYRLSQREIEGDMNHAIITFGIKTGIRNQYLDF